MKYFVLYISLPWQFSIFLFKASLFNIGKLIVLVLNIYQQIYNLDILMHSFYMNSTVVTYLYYYYYYHFSYLLQGLQSFGSNSPVSLSSIIHFVCHQLTNQSQKATIRDGYEASEHFYSHRYTIPSPCLVDC